MSWADSHLREARHNYLIGECSRLVQSSCAEIYVVAFAGFIPPMWIYNVQSTTYTSYMPQGPGVRLGARPWAGGAPLHLLETRIRTRTNTHPNDIKTYAVGRSVRARARVARKFKVAPFPHRGGVITRRTGRGLARTPGGVYVWYGNFAGEPKEGHRIC